MGLELSDDLSHETLPVVVLTVALVGAAGLVIVVTEALADQDVVPPGLVSYTIK